MLLFVFYAMSDDVKVGEKIEKWAHFLNIDRYKQSISKIEVLESYMSVFNARSHEEVAEKIEKWAHFLNIDRYKQSI